jgi:hypothetical protein
MPKTSLSIGAISAMAMCLLVAGSAQAVENGAPITPFGVLDFGSGTLPPPSDVAESPFFMA